MFGTPLASSGKSILDIVADDLKNGGNVLFETALLVVGVISVLYVMFKLPRYLSGRGQDNDLVKILVGALIFCVVVGAVYNMVW